MGYMRLNTMSFPNKCYILPVRELNAYGIAKRKYRGLR